MSRGWRDASPRDLAEQERNAGRRSALTALYEGEYGLRTPSDVLERRAAAGEVAGEELEHARRLLLIVSTHRPELDAMIARLAPVFPLATMTRIDRSLLRGSLGEVLHSRAATPAEAIAAWTVLARTYSGEPTRRLVNGVLGSAHREGAAAATEAEGGGVT